MNKIALVLIALLLLSAAYAGSPYWTVHQMRSAAESGDTDRLARYVDLPALRESFRSELTDAINSDKPGDKKDNPFAHFGALLANMLIGPAVDAMITPRTVATMIKYGKVPSPDSSNTAQSQGTSAAEASSKRPRVSESYAGLDRFDLGIYRPDTGEQALTLVLQRSGWFEWKVSAVRLAKGENLP